MNEMWIVQLFYQNKLDATFTFPSELEAKEFFQQKALAFKYGLMGWSASYPRKAIQTA